MTSAVIPALRIAIISSYHIAWLGFQKIFECQTTRRMVVQRYHRITPETLLPEKRPDVFILDMETEQNIMGTIRQIREFASRSKIVLWSGFEDKDRMREAFECGVHGVMLKIQPPEVMLAMIDALYPPPSDHVHLEQDEAGFVDLKKAFISKAKAATQPAAWPDALTEREREIIKLVGQGLSNKDIAHRLSISDSTVRHHLTNIFDKVGVSNRQKLLVHAHTIRSTSD